MFKPPKKTTWKSLIKKGVGGLVLFEITCLGVSYLFYRAINRNPDFRYMLFTKNSFTKMVLNGYYKVGDTLNKEFNIKYFFSYISVSVIL